MTDTLTGSEKQIAWATEIRNNALAALTAVVDDPETHETIRPDIQRLAGYLAAVKSAAWWIDNRRMIGYSPEQIDMACERGLQLLAVIDEYRERGSTTQKLYAPFVGM